MEDNFQINDEQDKTQQLENSYDNYNNNATTLNTDSGNQSSDGENIWNQIFSQNSNGEYSQDSIREQQQQYTSSRNSFNQRQSGNASFQRIQQSPERVPQLNQNTNNQRTSFNISHPMLSTAQQSQVIRSTNQTGNLNIVLQEEGIYDGQQEMSQRSELLEQNPRNNNINQRDLYPLLSYSQQNQAIRSTNQTGNLNIVFKEEGIYDGQSEMNQRPERFEQNPRNNINQRDLFPLLSYSQQSQAIRSTNQTNKGIYQGQPEVNQRQDYYREMNQRYCNNVSPYSECSPELKQNKYQREEFIAKGGYGKVYKGKNIENDLPVAIKYSNFKESKRQDIHDQLTQERSQGVQADERKILDQVKSYKYIIKTFLWLQIGQVLVQVMEFFDTNLQKYCHNRRRFKDPLSLQEVASIIFQLINSLIEIHTNRIVHSDIKPLNILINKKGEIKLTDFGVSFLLEKRTEDDNSCILGTEMYSSPEHLERMKSQRAQRNSPNVPLPEVDERSDIYSMGLVILFVIGIDINEKSIKKIRNQDWDFEVESRFQTIFTFVKDLMLCEKPQNRLKAIKLQRLFVDYFTYKVELDVEKQRIEEQIKVCEKDKSEKMVKYLSYLYCLFGQLEQDVQLQCQHYQQSYEIANSYPEQFDSLEKIHLFNMYGCSLLKNQRFKEGKIVLEQTLELQKQDNPNPLDLSETLLYIADVYYFQGKLSNAYFYHIESFKIRKIDLKLPDGHPLIIQSLYNIALILSHLGFYQRAFEMDREVLEIRKQVFESEHPDIAFGFNNFGASCFRLGQYKLAHEMFLISVDVILKVYQKKHPTVAQALNNLGISYEKQNNYKEALKYKLEAYGIRKDVYSDLNHLDIASSLNSLAILYLQMKDFKRSKQLFKEALKMRRELFSEDIHPHITESLNNLALYYQITEEYKKSNKYFKEAYSMRKRIFSSNHPYVICSAFNLANSYCQIGNYQAANELNQSNLHRVNKLIQQNQYFRDYFSSDLLFGELSPIYNRFEECQMHHQPYLRR